MTQRRSSIRKGTLVAAVFAATVSIPFSAAADVTKAQCVAANTSAQDLRRDHKLADARAQLHTCGDPSCPAIVRDDCARRLDELESAQPTILFDTKDGSGHDLTAVSITVDGRPLTEKNDGTPLSIDPGQHVFTFTVAGQPQVSQTFVLKEGEKGRRERIVLGPLGAAAPAEGGEMATVAERPVRSPWRIAGFVGGGVGVAGIVVGAAFGLSAISKNKASNANDHCDPTGCDPTGTSLRNTALSDARVSTATFIAGGVLAAAGVVLVIVAPSSPTTSRGRVDIVPSVGLSSSGLLLRGMW